MAKDQTALLQEISNQLKKMNQSSVREKLQQQSMIERQESILAGRQDAATSESSILTDAQDFKRRFVAGRAGAIFDKKLDLKSPSEKKKEKLELKNKKFPSVTKEDKRVGLFDINRNIYDLGDRQRDHFDNLEDVLDIHTAFQLGELEQINAVLHMQLDFWEDMFADQKRDQATQNRLMLENNKENNKEKIIDQSSPLLPSPASVSKGMGFGAMALRALPALVIAGVVALAVGAISDFVTGWKEDGLAGAIGKGLGGAGEGVWNSIKQSFKVGGLGATIGGAIGFLFGGVGAIPGAIIGGIIGMAIGAVAGYFGGDKITQGLKDAGKAVSNAWEKTKFVFFNITRSIANWIYTPGQAANHHNDAIQTTMFGGLISWNAGDFSGTVAEAWQNAKNRIGSMMTEIGKWFYEDGKLFGGAFTMPSFDLTGLDEGLSDMWKTLKDIPGKIKKSLMNLFPEWMQKGLGWISASTNMGPNGDQHPPIYDNRSIAHKILDIPANAILALPPSMLPSDPMAKPGTLAYDRWVKNGGENNLDINNKIGEEAKVKALVVATVKANKIFGLSPGHPSRQTTPSVVTDASTNKGAVTVFSHTYFDHQLQQAGGNSNNSNGIVTSSGEIWTWR